MKCWICGTEANSGEHQIKGSDLKLHFPNTNQKTPLFLHTDQNRNFKIGGLRSDKLKFLNALICQYCNSTRTQQHDRAWEKLSKYLSTRRPAIRPGMIIKLDSVFPGSVSKSMLDVHLFFIKQFGCLIKQNDLPIGLDQFSKAIINRTSLDKVFLSFCTELNDKEIKHVGRSHMHSVQKNGYIVFTSWFYIIEKVLVNVIYSETGEYRRGLINTWHPSNVNKRIRIKKF